MAEKVDVEAIKRDLLNGTVLHVDETPMDCTELLEYDAEKTNRADKTTFDVTIRTHSNETTTFYTVNPRLHYFRRERIGQKGGIKHLRGGKREQQVLAGRI